MNETNSSLELNTLLNQLDKISEVSLHSSSIKAKNVNNVIENSWETSSAVDYEQRYYMNARMPWFGSSSLSQKLSNNGTISEATGSSDSQIDELTTALVGLAAPIASVKVAELQEATKLKVADLESTELMTKVMENQGQSVTKVPNQDKIQANLLRTLLQSEKKKATYKLLIEEKGYIYIFTRNLEMREKEKAKESIKFDTTNGNYKRTSWPAKISTENSDSNTIKVSGNITLPKE